MFINNSKVERWIKPCSLILLMLQNVSVAILMRYVRTRSGDMFTSSTAVVCSEVVKLVTCLLILFVQCNLKLHKLFLHLRENILHDPRDWLLMAVPAVLYVFQNNLLFVAVSNLDTASFQVCYQLKLLTTALFFRILLRKSQSSVQWFSLLVLFGGIVIVQLQQVSERKSSVAQSRLLGFSAIGIASVMSGFSGVFFERILKAGAKDIWIRNIQLSAFGIVFGLATVAFSDGPGTMARGFFFGYDWWVWLVVAVQSLGGLLVAVVVKYADNILKGFATSAAIVLAALISVPLFHFKPNAAFCGGALLVVLATVTYSWFPLVAAIVPVAMDKEDLDNDIQDGPIIITKN